MRLALEQAAELIVPILRHRGIAHASIFGSFAHGAQTHESDLDLLIDSDERMSLFDLVRLKLELEAALGVPVDLVTRRSLSPLIRDRVLSERRVIL